MATSPVPIVDDEVGVGLNVADEEGVVIVVGGDNGWRWVIVWRIDEWICCKLCLTRRDDGVLGFIDRRFDGSMLRTVVVDVELLLSNNWFDGERDGGDFNCTNDWDLGVIVDDVDRWPGVSLTFVVSSIKLVNPIWSMDFSMVDILGGVEEIIGGESLDGSLRCRIAVIARRNCVVNFCFGLAIFAAIDGHIGESGTS